MARTSAFPGKRRRAAAKWARALASQDEVSLMGVSRECEARGEVVGLQRIRIGGKRKLQFLLGVLPPAHMDEQDGALHEDVCARIRRDVG